MRRLEEVFGSDESARNSFRQQSGNSTGPLVVSAIRDGADKLLVQSRLKRELVKNTPIGGCAPMPATGVSFYQDNKAWFGPAWARAARDPSIVAFQVAYWNVGILRPAADHAKAPGLGSAGVFLMAFAQSSPGQVPAVAKAIQAGRPPETLPAGGREWRWDTPPEHLGADVNAWHTLLLWQAMCLSDPGFRLRNRNVAFFKEYLSGAFRLPVERDGAPDPHSSENCDPSKVHIRTN